jgi:excisionase family DNA binding protein
MRVEENKMALLSPKEVAKKYGFSASQIRRLIKDGFIKAEKIGRVYIINEKSIKSLKRRRVLLQKDK